VFEDGGGYWYWTGQPADPARCGMPAGSQRLCYLTFNFRDGRVGARPPESRDTQISSIRLVRDIR